MNIFGRTDIGAVRSSNQDAYISGILPNGAVWTAVCDGMGGANGGNVASLTAVDSISSSFEEVGASISAETDFPALLQQILNTANQRIFEKASETPELAGMGTTAVLALIFQNRCYIAHVGDSRAYLFREGKLRRLTEDHSLVQELIRLGEITPEQARTHPRRNVITRVVGVAPTVEADLTMLDFLPGDVLLTCTDGLSGYADDEILADFMRKYKGQDLVDHLLDFALEAGGADNITVSLVETRSNATEV